MKRSLALLLVLALVVSLFAGCGDSASSGDHAQGITDTEILVGNNAATSGVFGPVGQPYIDGLNAYFAMVNDAGGVHGRQIKFLHQDDEFSPEKGKAMYDKLINDDKVFAIVGAFGTPIVGAILEDLKESGIPSVYFATGMPQLYAEDATDYGRNIYPVQPIYTTEGRLFSAWAKGTFEGKKFGVIYSSDDAGKGLFEGITKQAEEIGLEVVAEQVAYGAEDVSAAVTKILSQDVDVVAIASMQNTFLTIAKELGKQGNTSPTLTSYVNVGPTYYSQFAADIEGKYDLYGPGWLGADETELGQMIEWMEVVNPGNEWGPSPYAISGWLAAKFFTEGLRRIPEGDALTWEAFMDAMESKPHDLGFGSGSMIDYADGKRYGTETLSLYRFDQNAGPIMADVFKPFMTVNEILEGK
ncbi:MAG: ABC transporter substrate-binding protein [Clostridia bacterium]|nr:ABC transporter substrate-binding protein [Clostridia bacterium]